MHLIGLILSGVGLLLLGPSTYLGFPKDYYGYRFCCLAVCIFTNHELSAVFWFFRALWLNALALVVLGIAVSLVVVPTFDKMIDASLLVVFTFLQSQVAFVNCIFLYFLAMLDFKTT